jgi:predicted GH43/DUF377 family glycosyl hydrolase
VPAHSCHFDSTFPETGPPLVLTHAGIVVLYNNGKNATSKGDPDLGPNAYAAGTTFAEGLVYFHGQWFLYYGCADSLVAVAMTPKK